MLCLQSNRPQTSVSCWSLSLFSSINSNEHLLCSNNTYFIVREWGWTHGTWGGKMIVKGVHPSNYQISYGTTYLRKKKSRFRICNPWKSAFFIYLLGESAHLPQSIMLFWIILTLASWLAITPAYLNSSQGSWKYLEEWPFFGYSAGKYNISKKQEKAIFGSFVQWSSQERGPGVKWTVHE